MDEGCSGVVAPLCLLSNGVSLQPPVRLQRAQILPSLQGAQPHTKATPSIPHLSFSLSSSSPPILPTIIPLFPFPGVMGC